MSKIKKKRVHVNMHGCMHCILYTNMCFVHMYKHMRMY